MKLQIITGMDKHIPETIVIDEEEVADQGVAHLAMVAEVAAGYRTAMEIYEILSPGKLIADGIAEDEDKNHIHLARNI